MLEHWRNDYHNKEGVIEFAEYFEHFEWINNAALAKWYESASLYPSTNNGLERCNRVLKDTASMRHRLPFADFIVEAENTVTHWSTRPEFQTASTTEDITSTLLQKANSLMKENRLVKRFGNRLIIPAAGTPSDEVTEEDVREWWR